MKEYILVINYIKRKPVALVKSEHGVATVIAGDKSAEKVFIDGQPFNLNRDYGFTLLDNCNLVSGISDYIDLIGPVVDINEKLKTAQIRLAKTKAGKELGAEELARLGQLLENGVSQRKVGEIMGVSRAFVQRFKQQNHSPCR